VECIEKDPDFPEDEQQLLTKLMRLQQTTA
jgi:hypothetical protein